MVPKYIQEVMSRARFVIGSGDPGYTIKIQKYSEYQDTKTFEEEILRLKRWVERQMPKDDLGVPTIIVHTEFPMAFRHRQQYAVVTIYDPVMQKIEKYIGNTRPGRRI